MIESKTSSVSLDQLKSKVRQLEQDLTHMKTTSEFEKQNYLNKINTMET